MDELDKLQAQLDLFTRKTVLSLQEAFEMQMILHNMSALALGALNVRVARLAEQVEKLEHIMKEEK